MFSHLSNKIRMRATFHMGGARMAKVPKRMKGKKENQKKLIVK